MSDNKTIPAFIYNAEGIEITIKVNKFEFSKQNPVKPGFIASIIEALPPELILMFAEKVNSFMDGMNGQSVDAPNSDHIVKAEFIAPDSTKVDFDISLQESLLDIVKMGIDELDLKDRYQVFLQVDGDQPIEIPGDYKGILVQFLVENGYMNKTITSYKFIYQ